MFASQDRAAQELRRTALSGTQAIRACHGIYATAIFRRWRPPRGHLLPSTRRSPTRPTTADENKPRTTGPYLPSNAEAPHRIPVRRFGKCISSVLFRAEIVLEDQSGGGEDSAPPGPILLVVCTYDGAAVVRTQHEGVPLTRGEHKRSAGRILRVAYADHAAVQVRYLYACLGVLAAAGLEPLRPEQVDCSLFELPCYLSHSSFWIRPHSTLHG